jgi:hypothetical protein
MALNDITVLQEQVDGSFAETLQEAISILNTQTAL